MVKIEFRKKTVAFKVQSKYINASCAELSRYLDSFISTQ